jgi:hypothetical protein
LFIQPIFQHVQAISEEKTSHSSHQSLAPSTGDRRFLFGNQGSNKVSGFVSMLRLDLFLSTVGGYSQYKYRTCSGLAMNGGSRAMLSPLPYEKETGDRQ